MKNANKVLASTLAAAMAATMLAGCSSSTQGGTIASTADSTAASAEAVAPADAEDEAIARVLRMVREGKVTANNGENITLAPGSVCVHGDGAKALAFVQKIHAALDAAGVAVTAF